MSEDWLHEGIHTGFILHLEHTMIKRIHYRLTEQQRFLSYPACTAILGINFR